MRAIQQHEFGGPEVLRYEEVPDPVPSAGQVRITVEAAGAHFVDTAIRRGVRGMVPLPALPTIPGREVAGTVGAAGPGVDPAWVGRRVVAHLGEANGGYAELAVAPVAALHPLPDGLAADVAVAMVGTGRTAMWLLDLAALTADDVVLLTAAAGGLGTLFIQAARHAGATVVGAAGGPAKVARARELGADVTVDYSEPDWAQRVRDELGERDITIALDGVGGEIGRAAMHLLGLGGRLVMFGTASGAPTEITTRDLLARGLTVTWAIGPRLLRRPGGMRDLEARALAEAAAGRLVPAVEHFKLAQAAAAHAALESRGTMGKTLLRP